MNLNPQHRTPLSGVTRRGLLRRAGVTLALPWLEALAALAETGRKEASPPQRFACLYVANGVQGWDETTQKTDGTIEFGEGLKPLAKMASEINVIKGLRHENSIKGTHGHKGPVILSGARVNVSTTNVRAGTSLDQVLAKRIGMQTLQPSLVLGIEPPCPGVDSGLSSVYLNNVSWASPTRPVSREIHPALAFDSLFGSGPKRDRTKSILDAVLEDTNDLKRNVSVEDGRRLDEYLSSVREVERRVERLGKPKEYLTWRPTLSKPDMKRPADHVPEKLADHVRLMLDIIVLAFRMDRTRIATLMFNNERSQQNFGFLDGVRSAAYHTVSHEGKEPHQRITAFHSQVVAEFLTRLQNAKENGMSILHNSQILYLSAMHDGSHYAGRLPVVLAGRAGGRLKSGRVLVSHSTNTENHAIHRGKWIRERLLGGRVPDVPITVDAALPDDSTKTLRERMQKTRGEYCWKCHRLMDPLGLPFEQYDHFGSYRETELGKPVVTTGEIIDSGDPELDGSVKDPQQLVQRLAKSEHVHQVFVRFAFRFWMGRNETLDDARTIQKAYRAYKDSNGSMSALLHSLLTSDAFLYRKGANPIQYQGEKSR